MPWSHPKFENIPSCGKMGCVDCSHKDPINYLENYGNLPEWYVDRHGLPKSYGDEVWRMLKNGDLERFPGRDIRTQKGVSVVSLQEGHSSGGYYLRTTLADGVSVAPQEPKKDFPFFARPCPATPRHGFVDSRVVNNREEWIELLQELMACDEEDWEILCMDFLDADWNAIVTPAGMTVGRGHEGATAGQDAVSIPAPADNGAAFDSVFGINRRMADVEDTPYIEVVGVIEDRDYGTPTHRVEAVQVRDGPAVSFDDASIPEEVVVDEVVKAEGDLQEWEERVQNMAASSENFVVHHPDGSLASHYAVHCAVNDVPIVCWDEAPEVGERLEPSEDDGLDREDYELLADYIYGYNDYYRDNPKIEYGELVKIGLTALHAGNYWGPDDHLLRLRAIGIVGVLRAATGAIIGEDRHWKSSGPGRYGKKALVWQVANDENIPMPSGTRDAIYDTAFKDGLAELATLVPAAEQDFGCFGWTASYGGQSWAECSATTKRMFRAVGTFLQQPNEANWNDVVSCLNHVIHVSHNNAYLLTKFCKERIFDDAARCPVIGALTCRAINDCHIEAPDFKNTNPDLLGRAILEGLDRGGSSDHSHVFSDDEVLAQYRFKERVSESDIIHFQLACDQVNRNYGWAFDVRADDLSGKQLQRLRDNDIRANSMVDGSEANYRTCEAEIDNDVVILNVGYKTVDIPMEIIQGA